MSALLVDHLLAVKLKMSSVTQLPNDVGLGLRSELHSEALNAPNCVGFWEVHPENYFSPGESRDTLIAMAERSPISVHGVSLNLGGVQPLNIEHIKRMRQMAGEVNAASVSEHLAWTHSDSAYLNDLIPLPLSEEALVHFCQRVSQTQDILGQRLLVENPSTYLRFGDDNYHEADFIVELVKRTGCGVLLDVNNLFVSCHNHGWNATQYLSKIPMQAVGEIHIAGHTLERHMGEDILIDTHDATVVSGVWALLKETLDIAGPKPVLLERDGNIPQLDVLLEEVGQAREILSMGEVA